MNSDIIDLLPYLPRLLESLLRAIYLAVVAMILGSVIGILIYFVRTSSIMILRLAGVAYTELFRNMPLLVLLYLIYFGLPTYGIQINTLETALIALTLNNSGYMAEIYRAGINGVSKDLHDAAAALGMNTRQKFRWVILEPATKSVFPAITNQFILLFLGTSLASIISYDDLMHTILEINTETYLTFAIFGIGAALYYLTSAGFALIGRTIEATVFRWRIE